MKTVSEHLGDAIHSEVPVGWLSPVLGLAVCLSLPYYFSLETFFSHDDFAILWFHKDWPVWKPWAFLSPEVLTFYRPFQSYAVAVLYDFFGMTPFPYGLFLVAVHLANVVLFGRLVERLFQDRSLTLLAVIVYAADWQYWEVVVWKANYGTALSWLFVLAAGNTFLDFRRGATWPRYAGALGFFAGALLSKETAINAPLLLSLLYIWGGQSGSTSTTGEPSPASGPTKNGTPEGLRAALGRFVRLLGPFYALAAAYLIFHRLAVRDVYDWVLKGYEIQGWRESVTALVHALAIWLTPFVEATALFSPTEPVRPAALLWGLPAVLAAGALALRNRRLIFGILWALLAFFPANLIGDPDTSRYHYGPIMGIAVVYAEIFLTIDRAVSRRWRFPHVAVVRVIGSLLILELVYSSLVLTTTIVTIDHRKCHEIEDLYRFLVRQRQRGRVPPKTLFVVRSLNPPDHFHEGMGLREMFRLGLDDDTAVAVFPGQTLSHENLRMLETQYPQPVLVDRLPNGTFTFFIAVPTTATITAPSR